MCLVAAAWAKRTSTTMVKDTEAAAKEMNEATRDLCNKACIYVNKVSQASRNNAGFLPGGVGALRVVQGPPMLVSSR